MKRMRWMVVLAALALVVSGCEKEKAPEAPKQEKPAEQATAPPQGTVPSAEVKKEVAEQKKEAQEKTSLPEVGKQIEAAAAKPPVTVTFDASYGKVTFDHQGHSGRLACNSCHPSDPPGKFPLGKDKAHQMCKGCHQEKGAGPVKCEGCHKKA